MIVIKGKSEKSIHLENLIRKEFLTNNVLILDAAEGKRIWSEGDWATVWIIDGCSTYEQVIGQFEDNRDAWKSFDWVAFYVNSGEDSIKQFQELDRKYPQNFIVTIQSDNGITGRYFL